MYDGTTAKGFLFMLVRVLVYRLEYINLSYLKREKDVFCLS